MLKCVIIDDERSAIDVLLHHINKVDYLQLVGYAMDGLKGLDIVEKNNADLVFLDVRMPEMSGIDLLAIFPAGCKVIFTTAYKEYAFDGYELEVVDYLLKPISLPRFIKACNKAKHILTQESHTGYKKDDHIFVKTGTKGKLVKIYLSSILYLESLKNYVQIYQETGSVLVAGNLKDFETVLLKPRFMRVHRSYIVSVDKIIAIEQGCAVFHPKLSPVPIGIFYKDEFAQIINKSTF